MNLETTNRYLSIYQLVGFLIVFGVITVTSLESGRMAVLYIPISGMLFLPFLIVAGFGLLNREKHSRKIKVGIYMGLFFLVVPSFSLPGFFELGGLVVAAICVSIAAAVFFAHKHLERQLIIINTIGGLLLTAIIVSLIGS